MDALDVNEKPIPRAQIETPDQAANWINELMQEMLLWRRQCNVAIPGNPKATAIQQQRNMWTFLTKQGQVIGALKTLMMCNLISEKMFQEYNQRAINSLIPEVVGQI